MSSLSTLRAIVRTAQSAGRGLTPAEVSDFADAESVYLEDRHLTQPDGDPKDRLTHYLDERAHRDAFERWLANGNGEFNLRAEEDRKLLQAKTQEARAQGTIAGDKGGFLVPESVAGEIFEAQKAVGGIINAPITVLRTQSGEDIPYPTLDETTEVGQRVTENTQTSTASTESDYGSTDVKSWMYSSKRIRVANQLLMDSGVNFASHVAARCGRRLARAQGPDFINGGGTAVDEPEGLLTSPAVTVGKTAAGSTTFQPEDLTAVYASVDAAYRSQGVWVISPEADEWLLGKISASTTETIEDNLALEYLQRGTILRRPVYIDAELGDMTSGTQPVVFGDLSYFLVRRVRGVVIQRLRETRADYWQTEFQAFERADSKFVSKSAGPVKTLKLA